MTHLAHTSVYDASAIACATVAAVFDIRERRIPNRLTGPAMLAGLLLHLALGGPSQMGWALLAGVLAGAVFLVFYIAGGMGAGDVKLMMALGMLASTGAVKNVVIDSVIAGAVFGVAMALYRGAFRQTLRNVFTLVLHHQQNGLQAHPELNVENRSALRLPYAVPMALGCVLAVGMSVFSGAAR